MQHPGSAANTSHNASSQLGRDAMRDEGVEVEVEGDERRVAEDSNQDVVVVSTRHRAAICSGRLDMIIESESGETGAAKAISDCSKPFQGESTRENFSTFWREVFPYRGRREEYIYIERVLGRCAGMCGNGYRKSEVFLKGFTEFEGAEVCHRKVQNDPQIVISEPPIADTT